MNKERITQDSLFFISYSFSCKEAKILSASTPNAGKYVIMQSLRVMLPVSMNQLHRSIKSEKKNMLLPIAIKRRDFFFSDK